MANRTTWKRRVADWKASGLTSAEYCAGRGYAPSTLKWWSSMLNRPEEGLVATMAEARERMSLVRLVRAPESPRVVECPLVVEHGAVRVSLRRGFDPVVLGALLDVLDARGRGTGAHT